ncbi:8-amino-7-oxononanoate synthase [Luteithermobacter gelatinilyticus]|uniref:8-amino-7-oxononanoate synthase n=1 Tax=Luteithermobacter gelatinilyticus TaxID=2582913 RepID=UPI001105DFBC|nr:8-amino-7-oxononanoate synthase [Luteithermobacter gelatinilyticus]
MDSLDKFAAEKLKKLEARGLRRRLKTTHRSSRGLAQRNGRELISFCCNDYLNFTQHPAIRQAAKDAIDGYGAGSGASRLITGNHPLIEELETCLARFKGTEAACVFSSGYMANIGIIPCLVGEGDVIFADALIHNSLLAGSRLSRAELILFRHNDLDHLEELLHSLRGAYPRAMILTDGVFSMDGDLAPLPGLAALARDHDCWLMTDDAHGIGVVGPDEDGIRRGSATCFSPRPHIPLQMGTLSKAIGSFGGYLCASRTVIDFIKTRARSLIYTTASPPASIAAALKALEIIETDPDYCARPMQKARLFTAALGLPAPQSPIVPLIVGDTEKTMNYAARLEDQGFLVTGIRPPTVPDGTARLRLTFSAAHRDEDVLRLAEAIRGLGLDLETRA